MQTKLPFDTTKPIVGEASIEIDKPIDEVFEFIGEHFFDNYPKWAVELVDFEPLDGKQVFKGARAKQVRDENGERVESIFEILDFTPVFKLIFKGLNAPYKHNYLLTNNTENKHTRLNFRFELLELEFFMRPFQKLIRIAIEDGAENTVENIKNLLINQSH
ncbi:hypothetical protein GO003_004275 [Methylicorpusculum oleiharenae]|uniref:SRPBCC family protein n=1 Tax=Methylicorpusculum oleiharenae TaxID=1338687 RepID=UPI00135970E5|nr:SRPBCC family protein [Methylicorpusculum oleiharenae]MCD2449602.1 hypothetical protein [Methylicorpusculum oleiharenae]